VRPNKAWFSVNFVDARAVRPYRIGETLVPAMHPASGAISHPVNLKKVAAAEVGPQLPGKYSPETMLVWDFSGEGEGVT